MSEYLNRLAEREEDIKVIAAEDIMSDNGVLLAKSGTRFNKKLYNQVLNFKLLKPFEDTIFIENQLSSKKIYEQIVQLVDKDESLKFINDCYNRPKLLVRCCIVLDKYPLLLQKLTVLDMEITNIFNQSLISAYLAYICGLINNLPQHTIEEYFLAGLIHDIGLLHIDRYILTKKETLTANEWNKIQSHPLIVKEILKQITKLPQSVITGIADHHENLDGSGYPKAKTANDISELGQLLNLLDTVIVIYNKKLKPYNRSMHGIIPVIQINMHAYQAGVVSVVFKMLKEVPATKIEKSEYIILKHLIGYAEAQKTYTNKIVNVIKNTNDSLGFRHNNPEIYAIQNIAINILLIIHSAGLEEDQDFNWMEQLEDSNQDQQALYTEVDDTRLIQEEIMYQLQSYQKAANIFYNKYRGEAVVEKFEPVLDIFSKTRPPEKAPALKQYWQNFEQLSKTAS